MTDRDYIAEVQKKVGCCHPWGYDYASGDGVSVGMKRCRKCKAETEIMTDLPHTPDCRTLWDILQVVKKYYIYVGVVSVDGAIFIEHQGRYMGCESEVDCTQKIARIIVETLEGGQSKP